MYDRMRRLNVWSCSTWFLFLSITVFLSYLAHIIFLCTRMMSAFVPQNGLDTKIEKSRKQLKERKNRAKKIRGVKKVGHASPIPPFLWHFLSPISLVLISLIIWHMVFTVFLLQTKAGDAAKGGKKKWALGFFFTIFFVLETISFC